MYVSDEKKSLEKNALDYNIEGIYILLEEDIKFEKENGGNFIMCSNGCS